MIIVVLGWGRRREDQGSSFSGFSFSACIILYFAFENQNNGCDKQQNICFKHEDLILKIYTRTRRYSFLYGHGDYEKIR